MTAKIISLDKQRQRMGLSLRRVTGDTSPAVEPAAESSIEVGAEPSAEDEAAA